MAKKDIEKENPDLNGDEAPAEASTVIGDSAAVPSSSTEPEITSTPVAVVADNDDTTEEKRGLKRRASAAFSDEGKEEFRGFGDVANLNDSTVEFYRMLERMEEEISAASQNLIPTRQVTAVSSVIRGNKRLKHETDGSRPSSSLSVRSEGEFGISSSTDVPSSAASSPTVRSRRSTVELSSPLLRVPMERGWKRELVYRAAFDAHARRIADVYYYTASGKKLRSAREVSEHLSGTGLTLENFSFFKEPLGLDDPEKEIIRDAKLIRRLDSPISSPVPPVIIEGKRTPKPKAPKGASPEPPAKAQPTKIKVKSMGSRLGNNSVTNAAPKTTRKPLPATSQTDNNNSSTWKKPRLIAPPPPPPLQSRPPPTEAASANITQSPQLQPCSMTCAGGRGAVPSLACDACLCLYHPACVGQPPDYRPARFLCRNCRSASPTMEPPPLTHKTGVRAGHSPVPPLSAPRAPAPPARPIAPEKRVMLRMKMARGGPGGQSVWSVSPQSVPRPRVPPPQGLALLNGRRFIVVPRAMHHNIERQYEAARRGRLERSNGEVSPTTALSPSAGRRRGRPRDDNDYFTPFYKLSQERGYHVAVQIFQYLGMRDMAKCAQVCRLWREMAATQKLWRHVRMKNSQVTDWDGLCSALKRSGTKRLDLRKMLLPSNDTEFWELFAKNISTVNTLEKIDMCRCPARAVEAVCRGLPGLHSLSAVAVRDAILDPAPLALMPGLLELRLKSMAGLALSSDLGSLATLKHLQHLSLTSIKELGSCACDVVGQLKQLISLELGECTFGAEFGAVLSNLQLLQRLRLERGTAECAAPALLRALATLPSLTQLELVNFDVKVGFDEALAECRNVQRLLIIPTYVSQSATTNKQVLSGVLQLRDTLTHLMWGVTIELLRVTELFIDQCDQNSDKKKPDVGECIPVLKPVPGCKPTDRHPHVAGPPQVEILPLPTLQRLLSSQLPRTKLKLLRIPFHATWRQSLQDFQ